MIGNNIGVTITFILYILMMLGVGYVAWNAPPTSRITFGGRPSAPARHRVPVLI